MPAFGRRAALDPRDRNFPLRALLGPRSARMYRYWNDSGWWGDQGPLPQCVGYSLVHYLEDGPVSQRGQAPCIAPAIVYREAQLVDEWEGEDYDGTSVRAGAKVLKEHGFIASYHWAFTLDELVEALLETGPVVMGTNWYCVTPDQRILTTDLRWIPAGKLNIGDGVIGFDEHGRGDACYREASITSVDKIIRPVYEVITDRGMTTVSAEHRFLRCSLKSRRQWAEAQHLKVGDRLAYFMDPFEVDTSWEAGWLAGFFDGEGTLACGRLDVSQVVGPTLDFAVNLVRAKGFKLVLHQKRKHVSPRWQECHVLYIGGQYAAALSFLGQMRPGRLLAKSRLLWEGRRTRNKQAPPVTVQSVRLLGEDEVVAVGTSTKTLIVEGLLSHNSGMMDPDPAGFIAVTGGVVGGHAYVVNGVNKQTRVARIKNSWGREWGARGHAYIRLEDLDQLLREDGEAMLATEVRR